MSNKLFPYDDSEWDAIVADAFDSHAKPHHFSKRYQDKKAAVFHQLEESSMKRNAFRMKKSAVTAIVVAAAVVLVPSTAFAVNRMNAYFQQSGNYQQNLVIGNNAASDSSTSAQPMTFQTGWLPEGMQLMNAESTAADSGVRKYTSADDQGLSMFLWKMDSHDAALEHKINNALSEETYTCGENTVLCATTDVTGQAHPNTAFNREVWISFPDSPYALQVYVSAGISEDDLKKIAENVSLTPCETEVADIWDNQTDDKQIEPDESEHTAFDSSQFQAAAIGETVSNETTSVVINSATIQDTFDGITTDGTGTSKDYSSYANADGTVADITRTWYKYGDGVNTLDSAIKTETKAQKILRMDLTYTNLTQETQEECVCPRLFWFDGQNVLQSEDMEAKHAGIEFSWKDSYRRDIFGSEENDMLNTDDMAFSFNTDHSTHKNNITDMKPGESVDVTLYFMVDADNLDSLYVDVLTIGYETSEDLMNGAQVVALDQLQAAK